MPFHGKSDRRVAEDAEVISVVRVFPDVFGIDNQVFAESLLQPGVEFIAPGRLQRRSDARVALDAHHNRIDDCIAASCAGKDQVLVERRFHDARIGSAKNGAGLLDVVSGAQARFSLAR